MPASNDSLVIDAQLRRGLIAAGATEAEARQITSTAMRAAELAILAAHAHCSKLDGTNDITAFSIAMQLLQSLALENAEKSEQHMQQTYGTVAHVVQLDARH